MRWRSMLKFTSSSTNESVFIKPSWKSLRLNALASHHTKCRKMFQQIGFGASQWKKNSGQISMAVQPSGAQS